MVCLLETEMAGYYGRFLAECLARFGTALKWLPVGVLLL
jgi:hypothetical protein